MLVCCHAVIVKQTYCSQTKEQKPNFTLYRVPGFLMVFIAQSITLHLYQGEQSVKTSNEFLLIKRKSSKRQNVIDYVLDQKTRLIKFS